MPRPELLRIPWSHFCHKAEWGLSLHRIQYDTLDVGLGGMRAWMPHLPEGTVPVMRAGQDLLVGSSRILQWADEHGSGAPLYPSKVRRKVEKWEAWADDQIGPLARREAYRCIYGSPDQYGNRKALHGVFRLGRKQVLGVLKFYKARRYDDEDRASVPLVLDQIQERLDKTGTGYLFAEHATAADLATAALWRPMLPIKNHVERSHEAWDAVADFVHRVHPAHSTRKRRRRAKANKAAAWVAGS